MKFLIGLLVDLVAWWVEDPERGRRAIAEAAAAGVPVPEGAPTFDARRMKQASTLAEALRAGRNKSFLAIFRDELFLDDAFGHAPSTPAAWVDVRLLTPSVITVSLDGKEVTDANALREIALKLTAF